MKRWDTRFFIVIAICFAAVWPFLKYDGLPHSTDAELHIYRLAELERMWEGGVIYPRWAANFYFGYGYPIFNYYAPLAYYAGLILHLIPGVDVVLSVKLLFILGIIGGGMGMYGYVRDQWGGSAALIATTSYVYAPYLLFTDPHARGVLPESLSFALFPWALWSLDRLLKRPTPRNIATTVLLLAAIITSHNLMALLLGALLFAYFLHASLITSHISWLGLSAFILAVMLSAFFWHPMVWEQSAIDINTVTGAGDNYDFSQHFLSLRQLFGWHSRFDWRATEAPYAFNVGVGQALLGVAGLIALIRKRDTTKQGRFFGIMAILLLCLMLPLSQPLWRTIPLLPFFQFPWRFLGATAACLAILGGIASTRLPDWAIPIVIVSIIASSLPLTQIAPYDPLTDTSIRTVAVQETQGRWRGTTSTADFVPITAQREPSNEAIDRAVRPLIDGDINTHLDHAQLQDVGATVTAETITPVHTLYHISATAPFTLQLFRFDFPGWQAEIDGQSVPISPSPEGWITVPIAAGQSTLTVQFGTTSARIWGWILSGGAALLLLIICLSSQTLHGTDSTALSYSPPIWHTLLPVIGLTLLHIFVLEPAGLLYLHSDNRTADPATTPLFANYADQIALLGHDTPLEIRPGDEIPITLYWQALRDLDENVQLFIHLRPFRDGLSFAEVAQTSKINPGDFPTENWPLDRYVRDTHTLIVPDDLAPGTYQLVVGLWEAYKDGQPKLPIVGGEGTNSAEKWIILREYTTNH